jgi:hypothetical protein
VTDACFEGGLGLKQAQDAQSCRIGQHTQECSESAGCDNSGVQSRSVRDVRDEVDSGGEAVMTAPPY